MGTKNTLKRRFNNLSYSIGQKRGQPLAYEKVLERVHKKGLSYITCYFLQ